MSERDPHGDAALWRVCRLHRAVAAKMAERGGRTPPPRPGGTHTFVTERGFQRSSRVLKFLSVQLKKKRKKERKET